MKPPGGAPDIRRILVALDASPDSLAALDAAAVLAAKLQAELIGVFVEDVDLLNLANSPFAREILFPAAQASRPTQAGLEQRLRSESERLQAALAAAAGRAGVPWSFRTVRGRVPAELMAAAAAADLLCLGRLGWSLGPSPRIGATALQLAASAIPLLLHSASVVRSHPRLFVYFDESPAGRRALLTARRFAEDPAGVTVLLAAADPVQARLLEAEASNILQGAPMDIRVTEPPQNVSLWRILDREDAGLLILGSRAPFRSSLEDFLRRSRIPVLLLGDGDGDES